MKKEVYMSWVEETGDEFKDDVEEIELKQELSDYLLGCHAEEIKQYIQKL